MGVKGIPDGGEACAEAWKLPQQSAVGTGFLFALQASA